MAKIDTHGLKMIGIKKASGNTEDYPDKGHYDELFYDRESGEVWTVHQYDFAHNWGTHYHDSAIIKICNTSEHLTMQQIADLIAAEVAEVESLEQYE